MTRARLSRSSPSHRLVGATALAAIAIAFGGCQAANPSPSGSAAAAPSGGAPAASTPASAAAGGAPTGGRFCEGMKITFFPGGTSGGGFETVVYNGAKAAEAAFGPTVSYQWSDWDPNKMITQFQEAMASEPDGIAVMGHPGDEAFKPLIDDAESKGILVTAMNTELQQLQAKYAAGGFGYVGAVLYDAGAALANEAIKRGGLQSGDKAFVWGLKAQAGRGQRTLGITETLEKAGLKVVYLEIDDATNADPAAGVSAFTGMASANTDLKAIFTDHGNLTSTTPTYMTGGEPRSGQHLCGRFRPLAGDGPGHQGRTRSTWSSTSSSICRASSPSRSSASPSSTASAACSSNTGGGFVDKSNVDVIAPLVEQQIR